MRASTVSVADSACGNGRTNLYAANAKGEADTEIVPMCPFDGEKDKREEKEHS